MNLRREREREIGMRGNLIARVLRSPPFLWRRLLFSIQNVKEKEIEEKKRTQKNVKSACFSFVSPVIATLFDQYFRVFPPDVFIF